MPYTREASHAGSWYTDSPKKLKSQLDSWIKDATSAQKDNTTVPVPALKAIIAPHAGYSYSGPTAAYSYCAIDPSIYRTVFVLGPSHHEYMADCAVTGASVCKTPCGNLTVDTKIVQELTASALFRIMRKSVDEAEHSIEMHFPYLANVFRNHLDSVKVVCIMVGALNNADEKKYGEFLSKYILDPSTLFVISSDFCHWGKRFRFTHYDKSHGEIHESIKHLDYRGMKLIEEQSPEKFASYLKEFSNTICGRHPIGVLLNAIRFCEAQHAVKLQTRFVKYAQSGACTSMNDSSVSYASSLTIKIE